MPKITELCQLCGSFVNLEYALQNGEKVKLLDDTKLRPEGRKSFLRT